MADQYTEVSNQSWFGRIRNSIKGILFGFVLLAGSVFLHYWNEGRAVTTAKSLKEGASAVVSVEATPVAAANNQKLIHVSGEATTTETVSDPMFGLSAQALRLARDVEMYQWQEHEKSETKNKIGGGTETVKTISYDKKWSHDRIDSAKFKHPEDHTNPGSKLAENLTTVAQNVTLGAFRVPASVIAKMRGDVPLTPTEADLGKLDSSLKAKAKINGSGFYFGSNPSSPAVGDQRVTFEILKPAVFSILAQQVGETFAPYPTKAGDEIERVESGAITAALMFQHAESENAILTWILRAVGFICMAFGFGLILSPIKVFGDVIPFVGGILGVGVGLASLVLAAVGSIVTIAIAWIVVRPLFGITLLALAVGAFVYAHRAGKGRQGVPPPPPNMPPPPPPIG